MVGVRFHCCFTVLGEVGWDGEDDGFTWEDVELAGGVDQSLSGVHGVRGEEKLWTDATNTGLSVTVVLRPGDGPGEWSYRL